MYRYSADHTITYTPDDVVLFRESPFAIWMERLTLENPDHGIPADLDSIEPRDDAEGRDEIVATLRAEGRNAIQIDRVLQEPDRRTATLAAMRGGADFIVNGHLAIDSLSGKTNLLMRTSGYSDLGDFLYIPCEPFSANSFQSAFRLCFTAELLRRLQGQLPPQMLIIRDGAEVVPLQTEDHIYYFRAMLQRFMHAMNSFRKHRMPDPAESAHFGRWSDCANEVLKQRAQGEQQRVEEQQAGESQAEDLETAEVQQEAVMEMPQLRVASGAGGVHAHYDMEAASPVTSAVESAGSPQATSAYNGASGATLVEQARLLAPNSFGNGHAPGHTPNLTRFGRPRAVAVVPDRRDKDHHRRSSDASLQNLEFIGSNLTDPPIDIASLYRSDAALSESAATLLRPPPAPNLRETATPEVKHAEPQVKSDTTGLPELEPRAPVFLPPDWKPVVEPVHQRLKPEPPDTYGGKKMVPSSVVDMDSAPAPSLAPVVQRAEAEFARIGLKDPMFRSNEPPRSKLQPVESPSGLKPFSNSLITSQEINDS